ncbi:epithelial-stromal interaction protein 1 [Astyanax mexicanus]|uniref:Epithelial-stromal interaction protein 1 n=1 Tax=Astyanax mexicanus TaxID=7994 RepID=A0A8T2LKK8_ASTMX|nr:epithelial-stromal interaction protein 1 [Astyanax mexicanus]
MNPNKRGGSWTDPRRGGGGGGGQQHHTNNMQPGETENHLNNNQNLQNPQNPQAQQPTHSDGFTMVPPNESRRSKMQRIARTEEENYNRWKEEHRPGPINLAPETLGGGVSLAEVRQRQQMEVRQSKVEKKIRKEEMDRIRREEEEEKNQRMKAIQREKANKLEMKKLQEEQQRRELHQHDLQMIREQQQQRLQRSSSVPMAASNSTPASSWDRGREYREARRAEEQKELQLRKAEQRLKSEILEEKQKHEEEDRKRRMESERLRVNSAFLDRLEASGSGRASGSHPCTPEGGNIWKTEEPQDPASSPMPFTTQLHSIKKEEEEEEDEKRDVKVEEEDEEAECEWAVMKLQNDFPYYERDFLKDIVSQCNNNYKQAYDLLNV